MCVLTVIQTHGARRWGEGWAVGNAAAAAPTVII